MVLVPWFGVRRKKQKKEKLFMLTQNKKDAVNY